jgi:catechol 2,3-dioxygenase-like lactoylglutathione lyase family enzyme
MKGVHHTGIIVSDLERSIDFYHGVLGLDFVNEPSPVFDEPELGEKLGVPGAKLRQVTLRAGDDYVELLQYLAPGSPISSPMPQNALGAHHVGFLVDDIEATVGALEAKGVQFVSPINSIDDGVLAGWRWVYLADPDGITLELVQVAYTRPEERAAGISSYLREREARTARAIGD